MDGPKLSTLVYLTWQCLHQCRWMYCRFHQTDCTRARPLGESCSQAPYLGKDVQRENILTKKMDFLCVFVKGAFPSKSSVDEFWVNFHELRFGGSMNNFVYLCSLDWKRLRTLFYDAITVPSLELELDAMQRIPHWISAYAWRTIIQE